MKTALQVIFNCLVLKKDEVDKSSPKKEEGKSSSKGKETETLTQFMNNLIKTMQNFINETTKMKEQLSKQKK